jgi:hypothetical protein
MSEVEVPEHVAKDEHKRIGVFIAVLAVLMALISSLGKNQANQMIIKEVQVSNGFAWYQAKRERMHLNELEIRRAEFELAGNPNEAQKQALIETKSKLKAKNAEYEKQAEEIKAKADEATAAADLADHKHHWFEYGEICMHIAVVLCSLTLLTDLKIFYHLGIAATLAGLLLASMGFLRPAHSRVHEQHTAAPIVRNA